MSDPLQHYVPKFMLRRFSSGKKDLVHAYDKHNDKVFEFSTSKKSKVGTVEFTSYEATFEQFQQEWLVIVKETRGKK